MGLGSVFIWPQPIDPLHSTVLSAIAAALPLAVLLLLMGVLRKSGLLASASGLGAAILLALFVWRMPPTLVVASIGFGALYAVWPILWIVFAGLLLYNLTRATGSFDQLRDWIGRHASGDPGIQAILVAFCFGGLLESSSGFGAPVAVTACLLVGLGFDSRRAVRVALIANTAPVAFGGLGTPIVALAGVTGLDLSQLSAMVGRQIPVLSLMLPAYLAWVVSGYNGLKRNWPAAVIAGAAFAVSQFLVSNLSGPYATDVIAASASIAALLGFLHVWSPDSAGQNPTVGEALVCPQDGHLSATPVSFRQSVAGWLPWVTLSGVMIVWSSCKLLQKGQFTTAIPALHNQVLISLYNQSYAALYTFQPLGPGTAVIAASVLIAAFFRVGVRTFWNSGLTTLRQLRAPGMTVIVIVSLAYLYNYSGMAYTLGAAVARAGPAFPFVSGYLGWLACFLSGSDAASNLLFGNLQVASAHQLHLSPVLLAATNSSGAVTGKMISPQNIAVGVTTVGLIGQEGAVLREAFWHSILLAALLSLVAFAQAYWIQWMIPQP